MTTALQDQLEAIPYRQYRIYPERVDRKPDRRKWYAVIHHYSTDTVQEDARLLWLSEYCRRRVVFRFGRKYIRDQRTIEYYFLDPAEGIMFHMLWGGETGSFPEYT